MLTHRGLEKCLNRTWNYSKDKVRLQMVLSVVYRLFGRNRRMIRGRGNAISAQNSFLRRVSVDMVGDNNKVILEGGVRLSNMMIRIRGNDNLIEIGEYCRYSGGSLWIEDSHNKILIGSGTTVEHAHMACIEDNSEIRLGKDCMLASGIDIRTGDAHSIIDRDTGKRLNNPQSVTIGNHVWIGSHCRILKGVSIGSNSIIATGSILTGSIPGNCVAGGIPGKVLKTNVTWIRERVNPSGA